MTRVAGLWSGHDASCCVFDDGRPLLHIELERHNRQKETPGDSIEILKKHYREWDSVDEYVSCYPIRKLEQYSSYSTVKDVTFIGHHNAHAAHAFYSSNLDEAMVVTLDGGGVEDEHGSESATTLWHGHGTRLDHVLSIPSQSVNIGGLWSRVTRYIFRLQNGWPRGNQAGTIMAMAAFGHSGRWLDDFRRMLRSDLLPASMKPVGQVNPVVTRNDPIHPYLDRWVKEADKSEQIRFDMAADLQVATEELFFDQLLYTIFMRKLSGMKNICLAGGVALNSVMVGKIKNIFPQFENVYVPPVPYDGGLCLGAAQYVSHHLRDVPRVKWEDNFTPYLGAEYSINDVESAISGNRGGYLIRHDSTDRDALTSVRGGKIVSVFYGRAESGRRALGHRSIVADPRDSNMKDTVNEKVKHRQWFRPFAPSVLQEEVKNWFKTDVTSPYMSFVAEFTETAKKKVPAVVHFDGTARLQTVNEHDNGWWYGFIRQWYEMTGIPILLNTSLNDSEPVVDSPDHAMKCFLKTDIDLLYFPEYKILIEKIK